MCFVDVEPCRALSRTMPRARKDHRCDECGDTIPAGTVYRKATGIDPEGYAFTHKECRRCSYDRRRIIEHEAAEGCHPTDSDPRFFGLTTGLAQCGLGRTSVESVPLDFVAG